MEQVKCPECGGTKCTALNNETYRCLYCGATIKVKTEEEVQQTVQQATQFVAQQPQVVGASSTATCSTTGFTTTSSDTEGTQ